jgi:hypothetical protein
MFWLAHVAGTQFEEVPHLPGPPPPQVWFDGQVPHWSRLPQPSPVGPHCTPCAAHVVGVHSGV